MKKQPVGDKWSSRRYIRGGAWRANHKVVTVYIRRKRHFSGASDGKRVDHIGFRIVRNKPSEKQ